MDTREPRDGVMAAQAAAPATDYVHKPIPATGQAMRVRQILEQLEKTATALEPLARHSHRYPTCVVAAINAAREAAMREIFDTFGFAAPPEAVMK